jgi:hypothetical protein
MKRVFDTDMVAHIWANQSQEDARNSQGNFYFRGDTIYSYRDSFPIARLIKRKGRECVLITNDTYSTTTNKHCLCVRRAVRGKPVFTVPNRTLEGEGYYAKNGDWKHRSDHSDNLNWYKSQVEEGIQKLVRGRDKMQYLLELDRRIKEANDYCEFFGLKKRFVFPKNLNRLELERKGNEFNRGTDARRIAAVAAAETRRSKCNDRWNQRNQPENKDKWLAGESVYYRNSWSEPILLRVVGEELHTSQGASVPLEHAKRAFKFIARYKAEGRTYEGDTGGSLIVRVGHFKIDSIDTFGNIVAGCHKIGWSEIERIAGQLGLLNKEEEVLSNGLPEGDVDHDAEDRQAHDAERNERPGY